MKAKPTTKEYPKPSVTVDCVIFGYRNDSLQVLLSQRIDEPYKGVFALPGGFVGVDETLNDAAKRVLLQKTGLKDVYMEQLFTFGEIERDPRDRVISVAYFALINLTEMENIAHSAKWHSVNRVSHLSLMLLPFDHNEIISVAIERLKAKLTYQPIAFELLPDKFIFSDLENIYETILGTEHNRRNFRAKMLSYGFIDELDETLTGVSFRPPKLFRFNKEKYQKQISKQNIHF